MKSNKVNLIFFLPNFSEGGAGQSILKVCNNMNNKYFNFIIISIGKCYYKNLFKKNTTFFELYNKKIFLSFFEILKILKKYKKENTIFISNINYTNVLSCVFIKLILGFRLILIERTPIKELQVFYSSQDFIKKKIIYIFMKFFYRFADRVIVNSEYTKKLFNKLIKCDLKVIYSPSIESINFFKPKKVKKKIKIISLGRLSIEKRFNFLIDAISHSNHDNFEVRIIGNGPMKNNLINLIKSKKLTKVISIKKFNKNYIKHLNWSNLYINTSDFEGFPNSVVEAINNNIFVLSRNSGGGINDIIVNNSLGRIISEDSPEALVKEIQNYAKKNKSYIIKDRKKVVNKFSKFLAKNVSKEYEKVFLNFK